MAEYQLEILIDKTGWVGHVNAKLSGPNGETYYFGFYAFWARLGEPGETFPDSVVAAILEGVHPVRAFRDHRGMPQAALAKAAGTSPVYLSQIERGRRRPGRKQHAKLAKALRVDADLLAVGED